MPDRCDVAVSEMSYAWIDATSGVLSRPGHDRFETFWKVTDCKIEKRHIQVSFSEETWAIYEIWDGPIFKRPLVSNLPSPEADLSMFSLFGRTGAPTRGPLIFWPIPARVPQCTGFQKTAERLMSIYTRVFYRLAVARVCLHVDDDNFVCEGSRASGQRIKARKGPHIFRTGPLLDKTRPWSSPLLSFWDGWTIPVIVVNGRQ